MTHICTHICWNVCGRSHTHARTPGMGFFCFCFLFCKNTTVIGTITPYGWSVSLFWGSRFIFKFGSELGSDYNLGQDWDWEYVCNICLLGGLQWTHNVYVKCSHNTKASVCVCVWDRPTVAKLPQNGMGMVARVTPSARATVATGS